MKPSELLECRWGEIRLFAAQVHTDGGRTQVVHELSSGDSHPVQDRGLRIRRVRCQLQFDDFPNSPTPLEAARKLDNAKNTGRAAIFQHPILGRFLASIADFNSSIDENSVISAEAEFLQEAPDEAVTPTGAASSGTSGESSVAAAAGALDGELAKVGALKMSAPVAIGLLSRLKLSGARIESVIGGAQSTVASLRGNVDLGVSFTAGLATGIINSAREAADSLATQGAAIAGTPNTVAFALGGAESTIRNALSPFLPASSSTNPTADASSALASAASSEAANGQFAATTIDARVAVASWGNRDIPTREIMIAAARISKNIAIMIDVAGLENDLALWLAYRAAIMLGESVRSAAIAATSETPAVFVMRILHPTALLPLAARTYGGAAAQQRARQITELNDISTPGWLPPGDYLMPVRPAPPPF